MSDPIISRDYRKQGNCFAVYRGMEFLALFVLESMAEQFILMRHDAAVAAHSAQQREEWTIKTEFFQFHG